MTPEEIQSRLLYRDALILVLDKPAGLPVHAGPKGGPNLERDFHALRFGLPKPPALAHRLDRDTSGCLILGRHRKSLAKLGRLFQSGRIEKTYWAIVHGGPEQDEGRVDLALRKLTPKSGWKMVGDAKEGQAAITDWRVAGRGQLPGLGDITWLELKPRTGRTHQIRVHCQHLGCPIVGDPVYGEKPPDRPLHLHARGVVIPLYEGKPAIALAAPPPFHMRAALEICGWKANQPPA
jgi:tRNA pseudouridine32 synthase/23S rRNA pseudouridine746 synthase